MTTPVPGLPDLIETTRKCYLQERNAVLLRKEKLDPHSFSLHPGRAINIYSNLITVYRGSISLV